MPLKVSLQSRHKWLKRWLNSLCLHGNQVVSTCWLPIATENALLELNWFLQFCWQVCRCVIFAFDDLIALIQSLENSKGVTDAVQGSNVFGQKFSSWGSRSTAYQSCQLFHQLLLFLLHIHLSVKHNNHQTSLTTSNRDQNNSIV